MIDDGGPSGSWLEITDSDGNPAKLSITYINAQFTVKTHAGAKMLRDDFAMHAPTTIPEWFDGGFDEPYPMHAPIPIGMYEERMALHRQECDKWEARREHQRCSRWPYAWADMMLAERKMETK